MTDARTKQIQEIEGLLAERRKYEQWLAQLEARKESTPNHVFAKVHGDYTARLSEAQEKLSSETGAVHSLATELDASLGKLQGQIGERTDERAEAELRASVGEFAGKEWEKLRGKLDSAIADLSLERDGIQRELDTLRALLVEAEPPAVEEPKHDVDDIAFLRSVLGRSTPYASTTPSGAATAPTTGERLQARAGAAAEKRTSVEIGSPIAEVITEPKNVYEGSSAAEAPRTSAPLRTGNSANSRDSTGTASVSARQASAGQFAAPEMPLAPSAPRAASEPRPRAATGSFGQPTPRASEGVKSLKCQECGTLNFPTEWYCERCGGELAAF
jgi:hypothetical protein